MPSEHEGLPPEFADRFTRPLRRFLRIESAAGLVLLAATIIALLVSNSPVSASASAFWDTPAGFHLGSLELNRSIRHWINDALMTLYFFVAALELKRELVSGNLQKAMFPLAGALGGMIVPPVIYLALLHGAPAARGWGTAMTTDTAFMLGALALLGARVPVSLRIFLLSLAIFDDVGAIIVVAVAYGRPLSWLALTVATGLIILVLLFARSGIRSITVYLLAGSALWFAIDASGIHPSAAGVLLGLLTPAGPWVSGVRLHGIIERVASHPTTAHHRGAGERGDLRTAEIAAKEAIAPVERIESRIHPWTAFLVMPVFALANAGVPLSLDPLANPVSTAVATALVVGKPVGVVALSWLAERTGVGSRPSDLPWSMVLAGSVLTGIGFTMSIFIADLALDSATATDAKVGILTGAAISGSVGLLLLFLLSSRRGQLDRA